MRYSIEPREYKRRYVRRYVKGYGFVFCKKCW